MQLFDEIVAGDVLLFWWWGSTMTDDGCCCWLVMVVVLVAEAMRTGRAQRLALRTEAVHCYCNHETATQQRILTPLNFTDGKAHTNRPLITVGNKEEGV